MRGRGGRDECDDFNGSVYKDLTVGLVRLLCFLIVFVTGVVIGLISSSHVDRYFVSRRNSFYTNRAPRTYNSMITTKTTTKVDGRNCTSVLINCEIEDCLSMDSFRMPKNLTHQMTDDELFWRASLVPDKPKYPFDRVSKVAFMFLTRGPLPFLPLWERFFRGQDANKYSIYVHVKPGFVLNVTNSSVFFNRQVPSQEVQWGTVSLVDAERRLLGNALLDFSNERFVLLSESCIPIYNFSTVYKYLTGSAYSFLDSYDDPSRYGRGRYNRRMKPHIRIRHWRKGSQWFEIKRALAIKVISDTKYYDLFKRYCTPDCYPDEHYLPTFTYMFYEKLNSGRTVTYVDWSRRSPHPATFRAKNVTESFIRSLRNNGTTCWYNKGKTSICYLFARKFKPSALKPLLNLTSTLLQF